MDKKQRVGDYIKCDKSTEEPYNAYLPKPLPPLPPLSM